MIVSVRHCSEVEALAIKPYPHIAMISITEPGRPVNLQDGFGALLRLELCNAEFGREVLDSVGWTSDDLRARGFPRREVAIEITEFLDGIHARQEYLELVVHCRSRQCRSAAVARFAAERFKVPFDASYEGYNETLYNLLRDPLMFGEGGTEAVAERVYRKLLLLNAEDIALIEPMVDRLVPS